jgi:hypothetical protein
MSTLWIYIIGSYLLLLIFIYLFQERFIFKPEKLHPEFVYYYDIPFRELFFDVAEDVRINGLHFKVENPLGLILYLHGNTRSIKGWAKYAKDFYKFRYDVVMVDYRGFGKSTGRRSEKDLFADLQHVYEKLAALYGESHLIVYGRSLGSGFAAKLASENNPRYLILDAPYYSFQHAVGRFLPLIPIRLILRYPIRTDSWIGKVKCHTYILHGTRDRLIPIQNSERLKDINPRMITLIPIHGGGHNNLPSFPDYHNFLRDILKY